MAVSPNWFGKRVTLVLMDIRHTHASSSILRFMEDSKFPFFFTIFHQRFQNSRAPK